MTELNIDLNKEGIYRFLKSYQVVVMRHVWENKDDGVISRNAHLHLISQTDKSLHRCRAAVIFFLDDMVKVGFLIKEARMEKGGGNIWFPSPDFPCEEFYMREMAFLLRDIAGDILNVTFEVKQKPVA